MNVEDIETDEDGQVTLESAYAWMGKTMPAAEELDDLLDDEPGCESVYQPCTNPVAWLRIFPCCRDQALLCDAHKKKSERLMETAALTGRMIKCLLCGKRSQDPNIFIPV